MNKYEGYQIAFAIFALVAILLIGFAMFAGPPKQKSFAVSIAHAAEVRLRSPDYRDVKFVFQTRKPLPAGAVCIYDWGNVSSLLCFTGEAR